MMRFENYDNFEKTPYHLNCKLAHNVPAVYEVGGGIQGLCEAKTAAANLPE